MLMHPADYAYLIKGCEDFMSQLRYRNLSVCDYMPLPKGDKTVIVLEYIPVASSVIGRVENPYFRNLPEWFEYNVLTGAIDEWHWNPNSMAY